MTGLRTTKRPVTRARSILVACLLAMFGGCGRASEQRLPLEVRRDIPLPQATRRFDYASFDPRRGWLFVADLAGGQVLVFDTRAERLVKVIGAIPAVHGVLAVPEIGRVYASATGADQVVAIDEQSLAIVGRTSGGHYPDGIAWAPAQRKIYVSDEHGDSVAVIDPATNRLRGIIPMGGDVGNTQYDAAGGLIYGNVQTTDELVGIDPRTDRIVSRARLPGCRGAHGLMIDAPRRLAYVACEDNARLVTYSFASRRVIDLQSVGEGPDVLAYDDAAARLYVAGEAGVISIFDVSRDKPAKAAQGFLSDNAHVVAVDPSTHRVFFPLRSVAGRSALRIMQAR